MAEARINKALHDAVDGYIDRIKRTAAFVDKIEQKLLASYDLEHSDVPMLIDAMEKFHRVNIELVETARKIVSNVDKPAEGDLNSDALATEISKLDKGQLVDLKSAIAIIRAKKAG